VLFNLFVLLMLLLDLGVFHRKAHEIHFKEAIGWTFIWIGLAGLFALLILGFGHYMVGNPRPNSQLALEFITGYVMEESLSVDNLFIFLLIFRYFKVPRTSQHNVLFWGIIGALITRGIFIIAGVSLVNRVHWVMYIFGAWVVYSGFVLLFQKERKIEPEKNPLLKLMRKIVPVTHEYDGNKFFVTRNARTCATPLLLVLLVIETTDVIFAADSIPAILSITRDTFVVYTSNVFAVLGLRSLYFALAGMMDLFHLLHYGVSAILIFTGAKMLTSGIYDMPTGLALGVILAIIVLSVVGSLIWPAKQTAAQHR
jgi:tellurite resistance protein TerC